jgi:hypothetical protein
MTRAESLVQRCTQDMAIEWVGKSTRARPKIKSCFGLRSRSTTRSRPSFGGTPPNVRLTAVSTEPTLISTVLFAGAGAWTLFCDSQNGRLFAPERQPNPRSGQRDLMLIRYGYELTLILLNLGKQMSGQEEHLVLLLTPEKPSY